MYQKLNVRTINDKDSYYYQQISGIVSKLKSSIISGCNISDQTTRLTLISSGLDQSNQVSEINNKIKLLGQFNQLKSLVNSVCNKDIQSSELSILNDMSMDVFGYFFNSNINVQK